MARRCKAVSRDRLIPCPDIVTWASRPCFGECHDEGFSDGGWGGIRTLGTLRYTRSPGVPNRPLWHPSRMSLRHWSVQQVVSTSFVGSGDSEKVTENLRKIVTWAFRPCFGKRHGRGAHVTMLGY